MWALQMLRGFLVGMAGVLPGLTGSSLLVLFGIYRPLMAALARPLENFRGLLRSYGLFFLAAAAGFVAGSRLLAELFSRHETEILYLFLGFLSGTLPDLFRSVRQIKGKPTDWLAFAGLFAGCVLVASILKRPPPTWLAEPADHPLLWYLVGISIGVGSLIPGVSVAFILMYFRLYQPLVAGIGRADPGVLIPVGLGAGSAILLFARGVNWLFRRAEGIATRGVLGLVAGSIWLAYPGWPGGRRGIFCLFLFAAGWILSAWMNRLAPAHEPVAHG